MKFLWTTLHVNNLEVSLEFYQNRLGLALDTLYDGPSRMAFLGDGETKVELIEGHADSSRSISLGFLVENLDSWRETLADCQPSEIMAPNPELRFCFFVDPDGYLIQLVEIGQND